MKNFIIVCCVLCVVSCSTPDKPTQEELNLHKAAVEQWHAERLEDLKSHNGWLNLAGLFWLKDGINSFGSDAGNDLVFPAGKIDPKAGYFLVKDKVVTMTYLDTKKDTLLFHADSAKSVSSSRGSLEWFVIKRSDRIGVRLRDLESEQLKTFQGIERYPVEYSWKLPAKFEPAKEGETIDITNVLGQTTAEKLAGTLVFDVDGKEQRLAATGEGAKLFVVFGDATNGKETYGAGRFIYVDKPDSTNVAVIDFNKAYNPPCAFTEFATCPLPAKQNVLAVAITAGEKNYDSHHGK